MIRTKQMITNDEREYYTHNQTQLTTFRTYENHTNFTTI